MIGKRMDAISKVRSNPLITELVFAIVFCIAFGSYCVPSATGGDFSLVPSISLREEYNDNVFFDTNNSPNKTSDFITTVSPAIELINDTGKYKVNLLGRVDSVWYKDTSEINATDYMLSGGLKYNVNPRLSFSASALQARDSRADRDILISGLVLGTTRRDRGAYSASGSYSLSEKLVATLSYFYSYENFDSSQYSNSRSHTANLLLVRDIGEYLAATSARLSLGYNKYFTADNTTDVYSGTLGASHNFSETWAIVIDAGARYNYSEFTSTRLEFIPPDTYQPINLKDHNGEWGLSGQLMMNYKGEVTSLDFGLKHEVLPASGRSTVTQRTGIVLAFSRGFTQNLRGALSAGYFYNRAKADEFSTSEIDDRTFSVQPSLRYLITKDLSLEALYSYARVEDRVEDTTSDRNSFLIKLDYAHTFFQ